MGIFDLLAFERQTQGVMGKRARSDTAPSEESADESLESEGDDFVLSAEGKFPRNPVRVDHSTI